MRDTTNVLAAAVAAAGMVMLAAALWMDPEVSSQGKLAATGMGLIVVAVAVLAIKNGTKL